MFNFFKRRQSEPDGEPIGPTMFDEANSPEECELERVGEHVHELLDTLRVDIKRRKFIGSGDAALGTTQLAQRIHARQPDMAVDDIE